MTPLAADEPLSAHTLSVKLHVVPKAGVPTLQDVPEGKRTGRQIVSFANFWPLAAAAPGRQTHSGCPSTSTCSTVASSEVLTLDLLWCSSGQAWVGLTRAKAEQAHR